MEAIVLNSFHFTLSTREREGSEKATRKETQREANTTSMKDYSRFACIPLKKVGKSEFKNGNLGENFIDFNKANLFILRRLVAIWMLFLGVGIGDLSTVKLGEIAYHEELKYIAQA